MRRADLRSANLVALFAFGADLSGANLLNADIRFIDLRSARFDANTLISAKGRLIWEVVNPGVPGRDLHGTDLGNAILAGGNMSNCNLTNAIFSRSFLNEANLSGADLTGANLFDADLTSVDLSGANLTRASLFGATVTNADFTDVIFNSTTMPDGSIKSN